MAALEAMLFSFILLADKRTIRILATSLCLVAGLLLAALIVAVVNRWRRRNDTKDETSPTAQLAHFRSLYEAGTISQEEFERLRTLLGVRMRESLGASKVADSRNESEGTRSASAPHSEASLEPPTDSGERTPESPDTGIRPA